MKKLVMLAVITLSLLISLDVFFIDKKVNTDPSTDHTDNRLYIERAKTILNGGLLYRDVVTKTPPLINYLLVPPVLFGASPLAFEIYFSFFIVLTVATIYYFLSSMDKKLARLAAMAFLFLPTTLATPTLCRQDESIVVFFFILPLLMLYRGKGKIWYSFLSTIGVWIKMHSVFLLPPFLIKERKDIVKHIGVITFLSLIIALPFLILAFDGFTWFLKFYLLGKGEELQGISLWRLLDAINLTIPSLVLISLMGVAILAIYIKFHHMPLWKLVLLTLIIYFLLYPKIHYEYFLMFFALSIPYMIEKKRHIMLLYSMSILSSAVLLIEQRYLDWGVMTEGKWFFVPLAILAMIAVDVVLIYLFYHILKERFWLDEEI